jgi:flagellar basal body-associated protein FliL
MLQKAKLDVIEILPEIEINIPPETQIEDPPQESSALRGRWAFNKLLLIATPALIVVFVIGGLLWFFLTKTVTTHMPKIQAAAPLNDIAKKEIKMKSPGPISNEPEKINTALFKDFIIDLKDKTGKSKLLMCDVAFDMGAGISLAEMNNDRSVRNLIYKIAKGKNAVALRSIEERKRLKKELSLELDKIFGDGSVKNVYFTNFVIM